MQILPAKAFHDHFEFEEIFKPGGTLSVMINDPLEPGSKVIFLTGLKFLARGVEDGEANETGRSDSIGLIY